MTIIFYNYTDLNQINNIPDNTRSRITRRLNHNLEEQVSEAVQAVYEMEGVDQREALLKVKDRLRQERRLPHFIITLSRIAAILFIPLLIASGVLFYRQLNFTEQQQFAMQEITSPSGVRSKVVLSDGSNVWLNAGSTIKFKVPFDKNNRDISLSGEAFFDVYKNPNAPFTVKTENVSVTVLGTRFNCRSFKDENNIDVVLEEGQVKLNVDTGLSVNDIIMKPGDRALIDKASNHTALTNGSIEKYVAWHNGKLVFDETPMSEVAARIGQWFGVDVSIADPKITKFRITTTFDNESLYQMLELLKLSSPIEIKYITAKLNQNETKSKVIISGKN
jgi:transmembrane sensor